MTPVPAHLEVRLYLLRALVHPKVLHRVIRQPHAHSEVLGLLDLDPECIEKPSEYKRLRFELKMRLEKLEVRWQRRGRDDLDSVLSDLQSRVGLSLVDTAALRLGVRLHQYSEFLEGLNTLTPGPTGRTRLLAQVLRCKLDDAEAVLQPGFVLRRAGWLDAPGLHDGLGETMRLAWNVAEALGARKSRWEDVLAGHCRLVPFGAPEGCRWPHLQLLVRTLSDLLHATLRSGRAGVNVLVHAPSAAGKTELVRAVAHQAQVIIYEIPGCNADGSPLQAIERLHRLADCQRLFGNMAHALLIDDVDDAFPAAPGKFGEDRGPSLKWLHELLERNARPVFWVMRDASRLPRSVLDRFAFVVGLPSPSDLGSLVQDDCRRVGVLPPLGLLDEPKLQAKGYSAEELEQLSKLMEIKLKEIPNVHREIVYLSEILRSKEYERMASPLALALGKDIGGKPIVVDIQKMPHLLVAGTTGSGKSVALNAMILSLLYKASAEDVRMIMIDPKMLELSVYDGIPHLLVPVVTDMKQAANALRWCLAEMERRYKLMAAVGVRNLGGFNRKVKDAIEAGQPMVDPLFNLGKAAEGDKAQDLEPLPYIVVVIDEFADMMMIAGKKVEELIARLAQKARAAGVHLILATQRPSVDVITGLIKANIPTRIAFQLSSKFDSETILDQSGAETLLGHGDMLYLPSAMATPERVHGAFVDDHEVHAVVAYLKQHHGRPKYIENLLEDVQDLGDGRVIGEGGLPESSGGEADALYDQAVRVVTETRKASISSVQRRLKIGYHRAARMIEAMEQAGIVTAPNHQGNREVLAPPVTGDGQADTASVSA